MKLRGRPWRQFCTHRLLVQDLGIWQVPADFSDHFGFVA